MTSPRVVDMKLPYYEGQHSNYTADINFIRLTRSGGENA